ncbi:unnamed protein product [Phytomonas sp. Hart1]|nr:unnamed protein product [Phytomonas sp. Hart1]|eukprot:CCW69922.1 unnamed protein product [Phytomonas sp. isolate Hart1]
MMHIQKEELSIGDNVLNKLRKDFQEVMEALKEEEGHEYFQSEYERIYLALRKSHESEKMLIGECQKMTQDLLGNAAKMQAAVKLSQGDHSMIEALKREIEKAWQVVDSANNKDQRARETVVSLRQEIASLQSLMEEGTAFTSDHTENLDHLRMLTKRLQTECEEMTKGNAKYTKSIADLRVQIKEADANIHNYEEEIERLRDHHKLTNQEYTRERGARERAEYQCKELIVVLQTRENELKVVQKRQTALEKSIANYHSEINVAMENRQTLEKKLETADRQLFHTQQSCNDSVDTTMNINNRLNAMNRMIVDLDRKILEAENEYERVQRVKGRDINELMHLQQLNDSIRQEQENNQHQCEQVRRRIDSLVKERKSFEQVHTIILKECNDIEKKGEEEIEKQNAIKTRIQVETESQKELEEFIQKQHEIESGLLVALSGFEKETTQCVYESSQVASDHNATKDELLMTCTSVEETKKLIEESEANLSKQQSVYEQVRAGRNQFSKKLIETQDEVVELKQKFKMMDHQLLQFKEELQIKQRKDQEEAYTQKKMTERLLKAQKHVGEEVLNFEATKAKSISIGLRIKQLVKIVSNCDQDLSARQQQLLKVTHNRDMLGTQLVRRNDEIALLNEMLRLQHQALVEGEAAYRKRMGDLRLLRFKISEIGRQANLSNTRLRDLKVNKENLHHLRRQLEMEKAKGVALAEEIEDPKSLSRRKIEGKDPSFEELQDKQRILRKRLIAKSEECLEKELILDEKKRLVTELQNVIGNQLGPEVVRQLNASHYELQKKATSMKAKASELNMTFTHINELKYEAERLRRDLHNMKRKFYEVKIKNDTMTDFSPPDNRLILRKLRTPNESVRSNVINSKKPPSDSKTNKLKDRSL